MAANWIWESSCLKRAFGVVLTPRPAEAGETRNAAAFPKCVLSRTPLIEPAMPCNESIEVGGRVGDTTGSNCISSSSWESTKCKGEDMTWERQLSQFQQPSKVDLPPRHLAPES